MDLKTISLKSDNLGKLQVKAILILFISALILPFIIHLIPPYRGIPMGAFLLPMFYIPFIAVFFYRLHVGLIIGALVPMANYLITGSPDYQFVTVLSFELMVFSLFSFYLLKTKWMVFAAPLAYLFAKAVSSLLLFLIPILPVPPIDFFINSISNAAPGIAVLLVINGLVIKWWNKKGKPEYSRWKRNKH